MNWKCRSCKALIVWAITQDDRRVPLVVFTVATQPDELGETPVVRVLAKGEQHAGVRYQSHFVTCPNADQHRRRTR